MSWWNPIDVVSKVTGKVLPGIGKLTGAGGGEDARREYYQRALDEYGQLYQPTVDQLSGGNIKSAYGKENPRLRNYQLNAIDELRDLYNSKGLDDRAKAKLDEIRRGEDRLARGAREAILMDSRTRGVSGGPVSTQMLNAVGSADRRSAADTQVFADAEGRAIDALLNSASLSGNVRGQDFQKMSALDKIKEFNNRNRANAYQQRFSNARGVTDARAGIYGSIGDSKADQYQKRWSVVPNVVGKVMDTVASASGGAGKAAMLA